MSGSGITLGCGGFRFRDLQVVGIQGLVCVLWCLRVFGITYSLHCSSFLGLPYRILLIYLVKPKKGTTMETIGTMSEFAIALGCKMFSCGWSGVSGAMV